MLIALHLGAHKTATTYIQNALELSQEKLEKIGTGYVPITEVRSTLTPRLGFGRPGLQAAVDQIVGSRSHCERLLISEENIMGGLRPSARCGFYPRGPQRLMKLMRNLGEHEFRIFFALRSYDEFVSAMYCEYIRHEPFVSAETYIRTLDYQAFSWVEIVRPFVSLVGAEKVTLWRYEDYREVEDRVFEALTGAPALVIEKPLGPIRESLSTKAVQSLASLPPARTPNERRARARSAAAEHPKGPHNPPFSAFDPGTSNALQLRYERDLWLLLQEHPDVRFLGSTNAGRRQGASNGLS